MPHVDGRRIEVGAMALEQLHDRHGVRDLPGPIREDMQRRASAALLIAQHASGKAGLGRQQAGQPFDIASLSAAATSTASRSSRRRVRRNAVIGRLANLGETGDRRSAISADFTAARCVCLWPGPEAMGDREDTAYRSLHSQGRRRG
jgi:hypothetical protein